MSQYIPAALRAEVRSLAHGRCAYCRSAEELLGVIFEIDHVIPLSAGGVASADNLCLSCPTCNRYKATRVVGADPESGQTALLFHPHNDVWKEHFAWSIDGSSLIGLTSIGRVTIEALHMNRPILTRLRLYWAALGLHPPD